MSFKFSRKQASFIQTILATLLFTSAFLHSLRTTQTVDEQISSRISDALGALIEQNEANIYDWASWDDTVKLVQQRYDNYFIDNFNEDTSRIVQLAVVVNNDSVLISGEIWREKSNSFEALDREEMKKVSALLQECGTSFTTTFEHTYLISSSLISPTESQENDLTYGCFYFGKRIPDATLSEIFGSIINNSKLNIKSISIQPTLTGNEAKISKHSKNELTIKGNQSGLFGSDVIAIRNQTILTPYQAMIIALYAFLILMVLSREDAWKG